MPIEWQVSPLGPALANGEVHLWLASADQEPRGIDFLSDDERAHAARFQFEDDRRLWTTSRVLLHVVLGRYFDTDPRSVELATVARGRRVVRRPGDSEWLAFSHARSGQLGVVAVARSMSIGVDLERIRGDLDFVAIARRAFGDDVADRLVLLPGEGQGPEFFRTWVREEARGKCRGTGLVEPDDAARATAAFVSDVDFKTGYAGALAATADPAIVLGCATEV